VATQTLVVVYSDLSGDPEATTVKFGLFGTEYEVDLTAGEAEALERLLQPYLTVGRRVGGRRSAGRAPRSGAAANPRPGGAQANTGASSKVIREWARANGHEIPDRGRIPMSVQEAFLAAQNSAPAAAADSNGAAPKPRARKAAAKPAAESAEAPAAKPARRRARKATV
jgi:hypothetical protein